MKWKLEILGLVTKQLLQKSKTVNNKIMSQKKLLAFVLAAFYWKKSLISNVAAFTGMPYISESSDIQSLFL